jgi:NAD(P)H dehydrogenase (quinone)
MHVLTILDHPNPTSFSAAVARHFIAGVKAAGHSAELADLHAEGFDPRWSMADIEGDDGAAMPADVLNEQTRIARADAICLVFPLYWWGMPAMTKGWVDRVWTWGWAYDQLDDPERSLDPRRCASRRDGNRGLSGCLGDRLDQGDIWLLRFCPAEAGGA